MTCGGYPALSGLCGLTVLLTQGVALGWPITPLRGLAGVCHAFQGYAVFRSLEIPEPSEVFVDVA